MCCLLKNVAPTTWRYSTHRNFFCCADNTASEFFPASGFLKTIPRFTGKIIVKLFTSWHNFENKKNIQKLKHLPHQLFSVNFLFGYLLSFTSSLYYIMRINWKYFHKNKPIIFSTSFVIQKPHFPGPVQFDISYINIIYLVDKAIINITEGTNDNNNWDDNSNHYTQAK